MKEQLIKVSEYLSAVDFDELQKGDIVAKGNLSPDEASFLEEMLSRKIDKLKDKHSIKV